MTRLHKSWCIGEHLPTGACFRDLTTHPIQENDMSTCPSPLGKVCTDPTCPVHFGGLNEAERLGLVVGAAYGTALAERDKARAIAVHLEQENARLRDLLAMAVQEWPDTSWAKDAATKERLVQVIQTTDALEWPETPESPRSAQ